MNLMSLVPGHKVNSLHSGLISGEFSLYNFKVNPYDVAMQYSLWNNVILDQFSLLGNEKHSWLIRISDHVGGKQSTMQQLF